MTRRGRAGIVARRNSELLEMGTGRLHVIPEIDSEEMLASRQDCIDMISNGTKNLPCALQKNLLHDRAVHGKKSDMLYPFLDKNEIERNDIFQLVLNADGISAAVSAARQAIAAEISLYTEHLRTGREIIYFEEAALEVESQQPSEIQLAQIDISDLPENRQVNVQSDLPLETKDIWRVQPASDGEDSIEFDESMSGPRKLEVTIVRARHLPKCDRFGTIDGYDIDVLLCTL